MNLSVFDVFKVGVGPSSSHTMGPMLAARFFVLDLEAKGLLERTTEVFAQLYGSLALTGLGHCTDRAILLGLEGNDPSGFDPAVMEPTLKRIRESGRLRLLGRHEIAFDEPMNLLLHRDQMLPGHSNGMRFTARDVPGTTLLTEEMYSIGGGAVQREGEAQPASAQGRAANCRCRSAAATSCWCSASAPDSHRRADAHERAGIAQRCRDRREARAHLERHAGLRRSAASRAEGVLPGVLKVPRRAPRLKRELDGEAPQGPVDPMEWVNAWALAVNEENAAGGQVVTAPTNGAAGIVPAVLHYYAQLRPGSDEAGVHRFLLAAGAIGLLYKRNASISGAEMGCQGEVGVACSMAAAGLAAALGGATARSRMPPRSAWSTISASPATRSRAWCRFPASSGMPWAR